MTMSKQQLREYSSPYLNWEDDFASALQDIEEFDSDPWDLSIFLIERILPFVEHQYTLYDSLLPAIESISALVTRDHKYLGNAMFFLQYVFRCHIRDTNRILVLPVPYSFVDNEAMLISADEQTLFDRAISFYVKYRAAEFDIDLRSYFDCIFLNRVDVSPDQEGIGLDTAISIAMTRYKRGGPFCGDIGIINAPEYDALARAIQGRSFPESELLTLLENDVTDEYCWANGSIGVIAGLILLLSSLQGTERQQRAVLTKLVEACAQLKRLRADDHSDRVFSDQFLLEDIGCVLFRERWGATTPVDPADLNPIQTHWLWLLHDVYHGHTYSLLHAGVPPDGHHGDDIGDIVDIYSI